MIAIGREANTQNWLDMAFQGKKLFPFEGPKHEQSHQVHKMQLAIHHDGNLAHRHSYCNLEELIPSQFSHPVASKSVEAGSAQVIS